MKIKKSFKPLLTITGINNMNIEKLLKMLTMELVKARESADLATLHAIKLEIDRFLKTDYKKLQTQIESMYLELLGEEEEMEIGKYVVTYKPVDRFALDTTKLKEHFNNDEELMKNTVYSHSQTKPSLKFKEIK